MPEITDQELADFRAAQQELRDVRMQNVPADQRSAYQGQLDVAAERQELVAERGRLNEAARRVHAAQLSQKTGIELDEFLKHDSLSSMDAFALDGVSAALADPKVREKLDTALGNTPATSGTLPAPGATEVPAGTQQPAEGASTIPGDDPGAKIAKDLAGSGDLEEFMRRTQAEVPITTLVLGQEEPASPPAPMLTPAPATPAGEPQKTNEGEPALAAQAPAESVTA